jgi:hypothetical protein
VAKWFFGSRITEGCCHPEVRAIMSTPFRKWLTIVPVVMGGVGVLFIIAYPFMLNRDVKAVNAFCDEMKAGLEVTRIAGIAQKHGVGFKNVRDPDSAKRGSLGIRINDRENIWFFVVAAPTTIGDHACQVYHNNQVVLRAVPGDLADRR